MFFIRKIFSFINFLIPKSEKKICIHSFPSFDDMTRGLLSELHGHNDLNIAILISDNAPPPKWAQGKNIRHIRKKSLKGIFSYMRSKYIFFTHGCFSSAGRVSGQISINVWHGMPIKKIGKQLGPDQSIPYATYTLSTSPFFTDVMSNVFAMEKERVLEVGLPRNDLLVSPPVSDFIPFPKLKTSKLVIWLPTYRKSIVGTIRLDGKAEKNIFNLPDLDARELDIAFKKLNIVCVIKPHPMAPKLKKGSDLKALKNIKIIDETWLSKHNTSLYELLALSDGLITDISSVLIDYLLTGKPMVCHFPDFETYKKTRGFGWNFEPTFYNIPLATTQKSLVNEIKQMLNNTGKNNLYPKLTNLSHSQKDGFTQRLFEQIGLE